MLILTSAEFIDNLHVMEPLIDKEILKAVSRISDLAGIKCYSVGGFVRDHLLGIKSQDIDFVVEGDSIAFAERTAELLGRKKIIKYPRFKTAKIVFRKQSVEFVSARSEKYKPGSRKPVVSNSTLYNDLLRRDFTINAMALPVINGKFGEVIDHFGGLSDLENKILRTPLDPDITYSDDPLRMLRCIRFSSVLGFRIERSSFEALSRNSDRINMISEERISDEFFKMMASSSPVKAVYLMYKCGLLEQIFPELAALKGVDEIDGIRHKDGFIHSLKVLYNISKITDNKKLRIAALMHDIGKPCTKYFKKGQGWTFHAHDEKGSEMFKAIAKRLKWSNELTDYVAKIIKLHHRPISLAQEEVTDSGVRRLLFEGGDAVEDLMLLCRADITTANKNKLRRYLENFDILTLKLQEVEEKDRLRNFKPPISGEDIMGALNEGAGPKVGKIKNIIVEAILNGDIENDRRSAEQLMYSLIREEKSKNE